MTHIASNIATTLPALGAPLDGGFFGGVYPEHGIPMVLIFAPKAEGETELTWGPRTDTAARSLIDGLANSEALNDDDHPAAQWCRALRIGGKDDWHLPSLGQMTVARDNLTPEDDHVPEQTTAEAFQEGGPEAFETDDCYWTSTEWNAGYAWVQAFGDGGQHDGVKDWSALVRAVRKVPLSDFIPSPAAEAAGAAA